MARAGISDSFAVLCIVFLSIPAAYAGTGNLTNTAPGTMAPPPLFDIQIYSADEGFIHSAAVIDATNGRNGDVVFATKFGLSVYNGSWSTRHVTRDNLSEGLLDDFVTSVEYDNSGSLWIGYPGGLQIYNGTLYRTIRDQQVLKDPRVLTLQRWDDTMWIGTGKSGIHRYRNDSWTWYQPYSEDGPGFYEIDSMALDPFTDTLLIATRDEGIWMISSREDPVTFSQIEPAGNPPVRWHVVQDPLGGVLFFNEDKIRHYVPGTGFSTVLTTGDLTQKQIAISDVTASIDGTAYVGTDDGIYVWRDGSLLRHLGRFEGIGTSNIVRWVFADARNRVWFATQDNVGYYMERSSLSPAVTILIINQSATPAITSSPAATGMVPEATGTMGSAGVSSGGTKGKEPSLLERIQELFAGIMSRFG